MMSRSHANLGGLVHLAFFPLPAEQIFTSVVASVFADIDLKGSWAGQVAGPYGAAIRQLVGGHRSKRFLGTHRFWAPLWFAVPAYFLDHAFAGSWALGYYSHLLGDKIYDTDGWFEVFLRYLMYIAIPVCIGYRIYRTVH